jgi:hypothetical protein
VKWRRWCGARSVAALGLSLLIGCTTTVSPTPDLPTAAPTTAPQTPIRPTAAPPSESAPASRPEADPDLVGAISALENAISYRFTTAVREGRTEDRYIAVVVAGPPAAFEGRLEGTSGTTEVVAIGERAWIGRGSGGPAPASIVDARALHDGLHPRTVLRSVARPEIAAALSFVGAEARNGAIAGHYAADGAALEGIPDASPSSTLDVWLDGEGRLVAVQAVGFGAADRTIAVDVTGIDDPANRVDPPS